MSQQPKAVLIQLGELRWTAELIVVGGGGGWQPGVSVSPYIWTLFYSIDGSSVQLTDDGFLTGVVNIFPMPGHHGDLGIWSMQPGDSVAIPDALGYWSSQLLPISVTPLAEAALEQVGQPDPAAIFGFIVLLLDDGGHIPASAIDAGRLAFAQAFETFMNAQLTQKLGLSQPNLTPSDLAQGEHDVAEAVTNAIKNSMSLNEQIWALSGEDSQIAAWNCHWTTDSGVGDLVIPVMSKDWGPWELTCSITIADPCPASAAADAIELGSGGSGISAAERAGLLTDSVEAMRKFRDTGVLERAGFASWWALAESHSAELTRLLTVHDDLREALTKIILDLPKFLESTETSLSSEFLDTMRIVLAHLQRQGSDRLKLAAGRAEQIIDSLQGLSAAEAIEYFSSTGWPPRRIVTS